MARFLIVGAGAHATALADVLEGEGHVVAAGAHMRRTALEHVAIVCWLDGSSPERFLAGAVDSSMRGFLYQAAGRESELSETAARNSIPLAVLTLDPGEVDAWLEQAREAIESLLTGEGGKPVGALS